MVPVDITNTTVANVTRQLSGSVSPGGFDLIILQHWLMRFGVASIGLRKIVGGFGDWMVNGCTPWTAHRVLMSGHLIGLDKCPGVRPVVVGETWRRMLTKCVLAVRGAEPRRPV